MGHIPTLELAGLWEGLVQGARVEYYSGWSCGILCTTAAENRHTKRTYQNLRTYFSANAPDAASSSRLAARLLFDQFPPDQDCLLHASLTLPKPVFIVSANIEPPS
jgi:hypothetical protein